MKIFKFFGSSVIATSVDFLLYLGLITMISPTSAHAISAATGMVINFSLQYSYVFTPTNTLKKSIALSLCFAAIGVLFGTAIIHVFTRYTLLSGFPVAAKVLTVGIVFFYNYFTRKFSFGDTSSRHTNQEKPC